MALEIVALQAGDHTSAAVVESGDVYMWGRNDNHQLGLGDDNRLVLCCALACIEVWAQSSTLRRASAATSISCAYLMSSLQLMYLLTANCTLIKQAPL